MNNLSPLKLGISVNFWVPILLNGVAVWDVTLRSPAQVPACSSSLSRIPFYNDAVLLSPPPLLGCLLCVTEGTSSTFRLSGPDPKTFCAGEKSLCAGDTEEYTDESDCVVSLRLYILYSVLAFVSSFCLFLNKDPPPQLYPPPVPRTAPLLTACTSAVTSPPWASWMSLISF